MTERGDALPRPGALTGLAWRGHAARVPLRATVAYLGVATVLIAGAWLAVAAATDDWIVDINDVAEPGWLHGPLSGLLPGLSDGSFSLLLLALLAGYVALVACADALPNRAGLVVASVLVVVFGLAPVVLSSDLFGYVAYARLDVLHHLNPYLHAPATAPGDPILPFVYWQHAASPYGPLYTLITLPVGGASLPVAVWAVKALSTASCLLALVLIGRAAPAYGHSAGRATLLVGANPLLLVYAVGGGHNDLVVMAAAAAAILVLGRDRRPATGGVLLVLATGLKVTGGLLLPFALAASAGRRRFVGGALAAGIAVAGFTVLAFGTHVGRQIARIATAGDFVADLSVPDLLGRLLGSGVTPGVRGACAVAAVGVVLVCLWRVRRGADWLAAAALAGLGVLCAVPSLAPWYVAWVLPAAALARGRTARVGVIALTAGMVVTHLPILGFAAY